MVPRSPSSSPNSASTPRGSDTARERYGRVLYQAGGGPSSARGSGAQGADDQVVHRLGVLERDDDRGRTRVEAELERRRTRVRQQPPLELRIDPRTRNEPRAIGRRARHEPVDGGAGLLRSQRALLDQQLLERTGAHGRRAFLAVGNRRVVVVVVVVAHFASSS